MSKTFKKIYEELRQRGNEQADTDRMTTNQGIPRGLVETQLPGLYMTPDKPSDPRDCSNPVNATSPFCGYNPISTTPFGIEPSISTNACGVHLTLQTTVAFLELPPLNISYINKECRDAYDKETSRLPSQAETEPVAEPRSPSISPKDALPELEPNCEYIILLKQRTDYGSNFFDYINLQFQTYDFEVRGKRFQGYNFGSTNGCGPRWMNADSFYIDGYSFPILPTRRNPLISGGLTRYNVSVPSSVGSPNCVTQFLTSSEIYKGWRNPWYAPCMEASPDGGVWRREPHYGIVYSATRGWREAAWMDRIYNLYLPFHWLEYDFEKDDYDTGFQLTTPDLFMGRGADITRYFNSANFFSPDVDYVLDCFFPLKCETDRAYRLPSRDCTSTSGDKCCDENLPNYCVSDNAMSCKDRDKALERKLDEINKKLGKFSVKVEVWDENPNAQSRQKKTVDIADVAKAIEHQQKQLNNIMQILGIEEFPVTYPDSLLQPEKQEGIAGLLSWLIPNKTRKIKNITQLLDWGFDQQSAMLGQLPQTIEYEDKNEKNEVVKKKVVLPDIASTLREIVKMLTADIQASGLSADIELKTLQNSTNNSLMILQILKMVESIQDYLDGVTAQQKFTYPAQVTPNDSANSVEKYLQPSSIPVSVEVWQPDKDDSLTEMLDDIRKTLTQLRMQIGGERT